MPVFYYDILICRTSPKVLHKLKLSAFSPIEAAYAYFYGDSRLFSNISKKRIESLEYRIYLQKINVIEYRLHSTRGFRNVRYVPVFHYSTPHLIELSEHYFSNKKKIRFK